MSFANDIDFFSLKPYHIKRKQGEFTYQIFLMGLWFGSTQFKNI